MITILVAIVCLFLWTFGIYTTPNGEGLFLAGGLEVLLEIAGIMGFFALKEWNR